MITEKRRESVNSFRYGISFIAMTSPTEAKQKEILSSPKKLGAFTLKDDDDGGISNVDIARLCGGLWGWDRGPKRLYLSLHRPSSDALPTYSGCEDRAWGFSASVGSDVGDNTAHWSGIVARRHDKGIWIKVSDHDKANGGLRVVYEKKVAVWPCISNVYRTSSIELASVFTSGARYKCQEYIS